MADVKVLAGDFTEGCQGIFAGGSLILPARGEWTPRQEYILRNDATTLELATESNAVKVGGAAAWGAAGLLIAGPVGLLAGALLGGRGQKVTFVAEFCDGKKLMGQCDKGAWAQMLAEKFKGPDPKVRPRAERKRTVNRAHDIIMAIVIALIIALFVWLISR